MTILSNLSQRNWRKLRRITTAITATAALAAGAVTVAGAPPQACVDCRVCVDGVCRPKADTYGYYQTQWRTWPKPMVVSATSAPREEIKLPTHVAPPPTQEDLDNPPRPPMRDEDMGDVPPVKPATGNETPDDRPRPAGGEPLPPPTTDKPDPFRDDPIQRSAPGEETSILIPPLDEPALTYGLVDEAPAVPEAVRSSYVEEPQADRVISASDEAALRLIGDVSPEREREPVKNAAHAATAPSAAPAAEGNPLRSGWNVRGESPLREPNVVTKFGGSAAANPLRR